MPKKSEPLDTEALLSSLEQLDQVVNVMSRVVMRLRRQVESIQQSTSSKTISTTSHNNKSSSGEKETAENVVLH